MKKILFTSILLTMSFVLFAQEVEERTVTVIQAKSSTRPQFLLGLGFDLLFGSDTTKQKTSSTGNANTFTDVSSTDDSSYDAGIVGDMYLLLGARILRSLDLYSRLMLNYGFLYHELELKSNGKKDYIVYNRYDFNIDANARYTFPLGSFGGPYIGLGLGSAFNVSENIEWFQYSTADDKYKATVLTNKKDGIKVNLYTNLGLGFLFKVEKDASFSIGYNMRYYFTSIFNEDGEKTLQKSTGETAKVTFGDNKSLNGINIEFLASF